MSPHPPPAQPDSPQPAPQCGQIMVEYIVLLALAIGIFALRRDGQPSLLVLFATAIGTAFERFLSALSLPV